MKQMTGYFSGYICKRQPVGRFQLRVAKRALPQLTSKLSLLNVCAQKAQLVNRMFSILEGRGKLRTAAEEYNLAANHREHDETHAEYLSSFTPAMFNGHELLNRLELELGSATSSQHTLLQTKKRKGTYSEMERIYYNFADCYGFRPRGTRDRLLYLSPLEFVMGWECIALEVPPWPRQQANDTEDTQYKLTRWLITETEYAAFRLADERFKAVPGVHYEVDETYVRTKCPEACRYEIYALDDKMPAMKKIRSQYILRKRLRPVVPAPKGPMPHRGISDLEQRCKLCGIVSFVM